MTNPAPIFDPEIQALLEEIVADPNSTLLRVPQARLSRWLTKREPAVSAGESLLTRAERHLVQEYRENVATMLQRGCTRMLLEEVSWQTMLHRTMRGFEQPELPLEETWNTEVRHHVRSARKHEHMQVASSLLERSIEVDQKPAPSQLAAASLRLVPRDETRIWLSLALGLEGQARSALRTVESVLNHRPSRENASIALEQKACLQFEKGDSAVARELYREAFFAEENRPNPGLAWLTFSLLLEDEPGVLSAAGHVDSQVNSDHPSVREHIEIWEGRIAANVFEPTSGTKRLAAKLYERLPTASGRILHVFA